MNISERILEFSCAGEAIFGIVCVPDEARTTGVVVVVGGPQYRVGSHRQFLLLSRALANAGYPVMRFDYRGMGDSGGDPVEFEHADKDIAAAIDAFVERYPEVKRIVLWGLCDAASASLLYWDARRDQRIAGFCLLNPWVRSEASLAKTHMKHYYGQRLLQWDFWKKLLSGKAEILRSLRGLAMNWRLTRTSIGPEARSTEDDMFQNRMARALREFNGRVMLILSGNDYTAKEFVQHASDDQLWRGLLNGSSLTQLTLPDADHTFSSATWRADVANTTLGWLDIVDQSANLPLARAAESARGCQ